MSTRDGSIEIDWPDQTRTYRLRIGELRQLQEKCGNRGPLTIFNALMSGAWLVDDIIQPIRLGLIGGGMAQDEALKLVNTHLADGRLKEGVMVAQAIVLRAVTGPPDEELKPPPAKGGPAGPKKPETRTGSSSVRSTETAPRSASRRGR